MMATEVKRMLGNTFCIRQDNFIDGVNFIDLFVQFIEIQCNSEKRGSMNCINQALKYKTRLLHNISNNSWLHFLNKMCYEENCSEG